MLPGYCSRTTNRNLLQVRYNTNKSWNHNKDQNNYCNKDHNKDQNNYCNKDHNKDNDKDLSKQEYSDMIRGFPMCTMTS